MLGLVLVVTIFGLSRVIDLPIPGALVAQVASSGELAAEGSFNVRVISTTGLGVTLSWDPVPNAIRYTVYRGISTTNPYAGGFAYSALPATVTTFTDNGGDMVSTNRGFANEKSGGRLRAGTKYVYFVGAAVPGAAEVRSDAVRASLAQAPVRGVEGDFWADAVLGQPNFFSNTLLTPIANAPRPPVPIGIEVRDNAPDRLMVADASNNRIAGYDHLGTCSLSRAACTTNGDCGSGGGTCALDPTIQPTIVIGAPGDWNDNSCNGDTTRALYPLPAPPASATRVCFNRQRAVSPAEIVVSTNMEFDAEGNLFVLDPFNHRVLKFNQPFATDQVADEVWGQADFTGTSCNREIGSEGYPNRERLCLNEHSGIDIDPQGNLWVADTRNYRVVRFPKVGGVIQKQADVALGAVSFTQNAYVLYTSSTPPPVGDLTYMVAPRSVQSDNLGNIYVAEVGGGTTSKYPSRVLKFSASSLPPPGTQRLGIRASSVLVSELPDAPQLATFLGNIFYDQTRNGLWVGGFNRNLYMVDLNLPSPAITKIVHHGSLDYKTMAFDGDGNLYRTGLRGAGLLRFASEYVDALDTIVSDDEKFILKVTTGLLSTANSYGLGGFRGVTGVTIGGNQLVVSDLAKLQFWNDYRDAVAGRAPSGSWFYNPNASGHFSSARARMHDGTWRLFTFVQGRLENMPGSATCPSSACIMIFDMPLRANSAPKHVVAINDLKDIDGNTAALNFRGDLPRISPSHLKDAVWINSVSHGAVRLRNVDASLDAGRGVFVDVQLNRDPGNVGACPSILTSQPKDGEYAPTASRGCVVADVKEDDEGNVWVVDRPLSQDGIGSRVLKFSATSIPNSPSALVSGIPASEVFGTNGSFTSATDCVNDAGCHLYMPILDGKGNFVAGANAYNNTSIPLVYANYNQNKKPYAGLGDYSPFIHDGTFDPEGNLYVGDWNWNRVLIYKKPFSLSTQTVTPTVADVPPENTGGISISGTVKTVKGNPIPGATVYLYELTGSRGTTAGVRTTLTESSGAYVFKGLPLNKYWALETKKADIDYTSVTTADASMLADMVLGLVPPPSELDYSALNLVVTSEQSDVFRPDLKALSVLLRISTAPRTALAPALRPLRGSACQSDWVFSANDSQPPPEIPTDAFTATGDACGQFYSSSDALNFFGFAKLTTNQIANFTGKHIGDVNDSWPNP